MVKKQYGLEILFIYKELKSNWVYGSVSYYQNRYKEKKSFCINQNNKSLVLQKVGLLKTHAVIKTDIKSYYGELSKLDIILMHVIQCVFHRQLYDGIKSVISVQSQYLKKLTTIKINTRNKSLYGYCSHH